MRSSVDTKHRLFLLGMRSQRTERSAHLSFLLFTLSCNAFFVEINVELKTSRIFDKDCDNYTGSSTSSVRASCILVFCILFIIWLRSILPFDETKFPKCLAIMWHHVRHKVWRFNWCLWKCVWGVACRNQSSQTQSKSSCFHNQR